MVAAQLQGSPVEQLSARTGSKTVVANPDGSFTTTVTAGPTRVQDSSGAWHAIDTTLVSDGAGGWVPAQAGVPLRLSNGGSGPFVWVNPPGAGKVGLLWPSPLPTPSVSGASATYANVRPGVDLVVTALPSGFSEDLVIRQRPSSAMSFSLPLQLGGASASVAKSGLITVRGSSGVVAQAAPPRMWGAGSSAGKATGSPVGVSVNTSSGASSLVLTPDAKFLQDPSTVYPVTVDPTFTVGPSDDTWMQSPDFPTSQLGSGQLVAGTADGGAHVARSFLHFAGLESAIVGMKVQSANLVMRNWSSSTCTGAPIQVQRITSAWDASTLTWANQPSVTAANSDTYTPAFGAASGLCGPSGNATWHLFKLVQDWANGAPNYGVEVSAVDETNSDTYRQYRSMDYFDPSKAPTLTVTTNAYPDTPTNVAVDSLTPYQDTGGTTTNYVSTVTPTVSATVTDPDNSQLSGQFSVVEGGTVLIAKGQGSTVTSGGTSSFAVPAGTLVDGHSYTVKVWGDDGTQLSLTPAIIKFSVDTTAPAAPTVSSSTYPANGWTFNTPTGSFTFSDTSSDVASWRYSFDGGTSWSSVAGTSSVTTTIRPARGWDDMLVQAVDRAGNPSASTTYTFGCSVNMPSPLDQAVTARSVTLDGLASPAATGVTFQYRTPGTSSWTNIPVGDVTNTNTGNPISAWPVAMTAGSNPNTTVPSIPMSWNIIGTRGNADGAVDVRAAFTGSGGPWNSAVATVSVDRNSIGGQYSAAQIGPGSVSMLTGAFSYNASEGVVSRTWNSTDTSTVGLFGPGWTTSLPAGWVSLTDQGQSIVVTGSDGGITTFAANGAGGWVGQGDGVDLTLTATGSGSATVYTLATSDGAKTTFAWDRTGTFHASPSVTSPNGYQVTSYVAAGSHASPGALTTTYTYNTTGTYVGLPAHIYNPPADGHDCSTTWSAGCSSLQITYQGATAATARVKQVSERIVDDTGTTQTFDVGCYTYDTSHRLVSAWDPRSVSASCNFSSPVLATSYGYDSSDRITLITPPGQAAWTIAYSPSSGKVATISRTHNAANGGGTLTTTMRYGVPWSTNSTHPDYNPDLSATARAGWAQTAVPNTATAVFPPGTTPSTTDFRDAIVHVMDVNGREIDTAGYSGTGQAGWKIASTQYDQNDNVVRQLTAANRDLALADTPATLDSLGLPAGTSSAVLAQALDTTNIYSSDGIDLVDTFGPLHVVQLPDGSQVPARAHTHNSYGSVDMTVANPVIPDPTQGGPAHAIIQTDESASLSPAPVATAETDTRTTKYAYGLSSTDTAGWYLGTPEQVTTVMPGGTNIVKQTRYDATTGQMLEVRQPSAAGASTDPGTTAFVYYTAGTNSQDSACGNKPAWAGLLCTQGPGAQPTTSGLPGLPVTRITSYDLFGRPLTQTETVSDAGGQQQVRTTTTSYDGPGGIGDRVASVAVTGGVGAAVPGITFGYSATTGLPTTTTADSSAGAGMAGVTTQGYDDFGQPTSYQDADQAITTTAYDSSGRPATITYQQPDGTTLGTTTIGYDNGTEHRQLPTSLTQSGLGGSFTGTYNADGQLTSQTWPDGMTSTWTYDPTGAATALSDVKGGNTFLSDTQVSTIHGQWATESGVLLPLNRAYTYDPAGRLTQVADTSTDPLHPGCTTRVYGFDLNSNRTTKSVFPPSATDGSCSTTTTPATTSYSYDNADRLQPTGSHTGLAYDAFGRITTLPGADGNGAATTLGYYVTDMVKSTSQGAATRTWTLDPSMRLRAMTAETGNSTATTNHYANASDSPAWTTDTSASGTTTTTRYLTDLTGTLAATVTGGTATWQLTGLHGDIERTTSPAATLTPDGTVNYTDEYGNPTTATSGTPRYGYLGSFLRSSDGLSGLMLMGRRLYIPEIGNFGQVDPILHGSTSRYAYTRDPVNGRDLTGMLYEIRYKAQCGEAGCIAGRRVCAYSTGYCSINFYWWLRGSSLALMNVSWQISISINGHRVVKNQGYGHTEPGFYFWHSSWGIPNSQHSRGYYTYWDWFVPLHSHLGPRDVVVISLDGFGYFPGGGQGAYIYGYARWDMNTP